MTTPPNRNTGDGIGEQIFDALADGAGTLFYDLLKQCTNFHMQLIPQAFQDMFHGFLRTEQAAAFFQSPYIEGWMQHIGSMIPGHGALYAPAYNHKMLAQDGEGTVRGLRYEQLYNLFPPASEDDPQAESRWPKLVLTSHHARGGALSDVTAITQGIESLMRQCFKTNGHEQHFAPLQFETGDLWNVQPVQDPDHQRLMIAYACDVDRNPFLNGAALLRRIRELVQQGKRGQLARSRDEGSYDEASQSAYRLAKVMLQCLVTEPERIDPDFRGFTADQPGLSDTPLYIRPDAGRVAQHLALIGYSKGGNVVSDAMRILVDELTRRRENGTSLFYVSDTGRYEYGFNAHTQYTPIHESATAANPLQGVKNIVRHIPLLSLASIEVPLSERLQLAGVNRVSINNNYDYISGHTHLRKSKGSDEVIRVNGERNLLGHAPVDAFGKKGEKGYLLQDEAARRRVEEYFCALYGAAAISNLQFHYDDRFATENRIVLMPAAGTSDTAVLEYCGTPQEGKEAATRRRGTIMRYLQEAGFTGVQVGPTEWNPSQLMITVNEPIFVDMAKKPSSILTQNDRSKAFIQHVEAVQANITKLAGAFKSLRDHEPDLVVNQRVDDDIRAHAEKVAALIKRPGHTNGQSHDAEQEDAGERLSRMFDGSGRVSAGMGLY